MVDSAIKVFGQIDMLVNNAGIARFDKLLNQKVTDFEDVVKTNLIGSFILATEGVRLMIAEGKKGCVINITSIHSVSPGIGVGAYSPAKAGLASLTKLMALEWGEFGIRVNAIGPLGTTRMSDTFNKSANADGDYPYIDPTLNGPLVAFLSSDKAFPVSGQIFGCGGHRLALMIQPHYGKTLMKEEGWSVEDIEDLVQRGKHSHLVP